MTMRYLNVIKAFLERKINEELYVTLPKRVVLLKEHLRVSSVTQVQVCARLLKNLYGLKQGIDNWFETLDNFLRFNGLQRFNAEP